jgi:hypothetical protein
MAAAVSLRGCFSTLTRASLLQEGAVAAAATASLPGVALPGLPLATRVLSLVDAVTVDELKARMCWLCWLCWV